MARIFELGDILTITTDILLSHRLMDGVYAILNYMTGDELYTHQLPRAAAECAPWLLAQHPQLAEIEPPKFENKQQVWEWLTAQEQKYGNAFAVSPLPEGIHEHKSAPLELVDIIGRHD